MSSDEEDDNSGSDSNVEDDDEDNSGSGSGSGDDDDSDGSGSSGSGSDDDDDSDDSDSDSKKKKKKGDNSNLVPVDITAKPSDELKTILTEMSGVEADVESFFSTLSSDTRNIIGFVPTKHAIRGAYQPPPTQSYSQYNSNNNNNNNIRYSSPIGNSSPNNNNNNFRQTQSQYNTYGAYRYQQQDSSSPNSNQLPMAGGAAAMINSPKRRESMEDVAEIQAILAKQHLASGGNKSQHVQNAQNTIAQSQHFGSERFKLNKESQNIIDHYYKNLYSRKAGGPTGLSNSRHNLNYSTVDDLYKASTYKHKAVYDEDDLRHQRSGKFPSSNRSTNDQKFFRGTGSQQQLQSHMSSSNQNKNQHKIDNAIKVLLGRRS